MEKKDLSNLNYEKEKEAALYHFNNLNWSDACECCANLIQINPNDPDTLFIFGTSLAQLGDVKDAYTVSGKLITLKPEVNDYQVLHSILSELNNTNDTPRIRDKPVNSIPIIDQPREKITLVTACMNRMEHLIKSVNKWIEIKDIDEIIIVDWNNPSPIADRIKPNDKIKLIRVISEEKWVLSYAYNIGITHAKNKIIFKCDADCVPNENIFKHLPSDRFFYSGYWKNGITTGKASVNGQCFFRKEDFERVNGYSEYIRTYGRDDEDYYDRLQQAGIRRLEIAAEMLEMINHSNELRTSNQFNEESKSHKIKSILSSTSYNEMKNYYIGKALPWGKYRKRATYIYTKTEHQNYIVAERIKSLDLEIPKQVKESAKLFSLRHLAATKLNKKTSELINANESDCLAILLH